MWPAAFIRSRLVLTRAGRLTFMSGRLVPGTGTPSTRRRPPRAAIVIPPTSPASAAPPAMAGPLALLATVPIAWPALRAPPATVSRVLCAPLETASRAFLTCAFTPPCWGFAVERVLPEPRLPAEGLRAPLDDARL